MARIAAFGIEDIILLLKTRGAARHGREMVSQKEHALQCAQLAEDAGAPHALVAASLLHDLGHLLAERRDGEFAPDTDDVHQFLPIPFLRGVFPEAVIQPIRLHVDAKRFLCLCEAGYWDRLSPASKHSLELQGGMFGQDDANRFMGLPYASDAVCLRRWDDLAKTPGRRTPDLAYYEHILRDVALQRAVENHDA
jgi:phosphonate degradation associated HDIG domain protein